MAELPEIGKNCALLGCKQLDFLPFVCERCSRTFCKIHRHADSHNCQNLTEEFFAGSENSEKSQNNVQYLCSHGGCFSKEYVRFDCSLCARNFCIRHRNCEDHNCPKLGSSITTKNSDGEGKVSAEEKLGKNPSKFMKKFADPNQQSRADRVALMKVRMNSRGNGIAPADHLFLFLNTWDGRRAPVCVGKSWSVTRQMDLLRKELEENEIAAENEEIVFSLANGTVLKGDAELKIVLKNEEEIFVQKREKE